MLAHCVTGVAVLVMVTSWAPISTGEDTACVSCIERKDPHTICPRATPPSLISSEHYYLELSFKVANRAFEGYRGVSEGNRANWYKAHQFCALHGLRLATIQTEEQEKEMEDLMTKHNIIHVWIGVTDLAERDKYYNIHNGAYVNYTKWLPGQPDKWTEYERCVHVWKPNNIFGWNDGKCEDVDHFACDLLDTYCP